MCPHKKYQVAVRVVNDIDLFRRKTKFGWIPTTIKFDVDQ